MKAEVPGDHPCHFYVDDGTLVATVASFLGPAFDEGQAIIAIGTPLHLASIERRLRDEGRDLASARARGQYVTVDAQHAADLLMLNGLPTADRFNAVIGPYLATATAAYSGVRAFGEIVSLLWRDGKRQAALRLEELWNEALGYHPLSLICGYNVRSFRNAADAVGVTGIISAHSSVIVADAAD